MNLLETVRCAGVLTVFVALTCTVEATEAADKRFALIAPGATLPRVVAGPRPLERDAAKDLCEYLSRISRRSIPVSEQAENATIVIHVGRDRFVEEHVPRIDRIRADGYVEQCNEQGKSVHLVLAGKADRAAQWAVEK